MATSSRRRDNGSRPACAGPAARSCSRGKKSDKSFLGVLCDECLAHSSCPGSPENVWLMKQVWLWDLTIVRRALSKHVRAVPMPRSITAGSVRCSVECGQDFLNENFWEDHSWISPFSNQDRADLTCLWAKWVLRPKPSD